MEAKTIYLTGENDYLLVKDDSDKKGSYKIMSPYTKKGEITFNNPSENDLEVRIEVNKNRFNSIEDIKEFIEELINLLKLYFYDKESIIPLVFVDGKQIDLECSYSNERNNILIPRLVNEIESAEQTLVDWGQFWFERYLPFTVGVDYLKTIPLARRFSAIDELYWTKVKSKKYNREFSFSRNGDIEFEKSPNYNINGTDYQIKYNVLNKGFDLKSVDEEDNPLLIVKDRNNYTQIEMNNKDNFKLHINKDDINNIRYISPTDDNSSIKVDLWVSWENIKMCNIEFRLHEYNDDVIVSYSLRIKPNDEQNKYSIKFISRDDRKTEDFDQDVLQTNKQIFEEIIDGPLTAELIDKIIEKVIPIVNRRTNKYGSKSVLEPSVTIVSDIFDIKRQVVDFVKQIKGEIPLPYLQENLENFIIENDIYYYGNIAYRDIKQFN